MKKHYSPTYCWWRDITRGSYTHDTVAVRAFKVGGFFVRSTCMQLEPKALAVPCLMGTGAVDVIHRTCR
jgi:hypothetical protein